MFRVGLYARVSTNDQQTLAMQNRAMREYAAGRGGTIAMQVREVNSGAARREAREKLIEAARRREIDVVLVWRLDRWGRSVAICWRRSRNWSTSVSGSYRSPKRWTSRPQPVEQWRPCSRFLPPSSERFCRNELAPARPTLGRTASGWAGQSPPPSTLWKSGNYIVPALVNPKSHAGFRSAALRCAVSWRL